MNRPGNDKEKAPVFKSWTTWYLLVLGCLVVWAIAFYFFTKHFA